MAGRVVGEGVTSLITSCAAEREEREAKIVLMRQTVNVDDATAIALLTRHNWMMERAVEFHLAEQARQVRSHLFHLPSLLISNA